MMCLLDVDSDDLTTFSILEYGEASVFNKFDTASMSPMSSMSIVGFDTGKLCDHHAMWPHIKLNPTNHQPLSNNPKPNQTHLAHPRTADTLHLIANTIMKSPPPLPPQRHIGHIGHTILWDFASLCACLFVMLLGLCVFCVSLNASIRTRPLDWA